MGVMNGIVVICGILRSIQRCHVGFVGLFCIFHFCEFCGIPLSILAIFMVFRWVRFVIFCFNLDREAEVEPRPGIRPRMERLRYIGAVRPENVWFFAGRFRVRWAKANRQVRPTTGAVSYVAMSCHSEGNFHRFWKSVILPGSIELRFLIKH